MSLLICPFHLLLRSLPSLSYLLDFPCYFSWNVSLFSSLQIIPPGMEFHHIAPLDGDMDGEIETNEEHPRSPDPPIWSEVLVTSYPFNFNLIPKRQLIGFFLIYPLLSL